jgi:hypothetical protein
MNYLLFIVLLVVTLITAGCISGDNSNTVTPTPQIVYVTVLVTQTPTIITPTTTTTQDCQCDFAGGCKEISSKIDQLITIREDCAAEMVRRSIEARNSKETNTSYYMSNNPACDAYSSCTNHCIFELQQYYNKSCLSGLQI